MKALFIGLGGIGQRHLRNFHAATIGRGERAEVLAYRVRRRGDVLTDQLRVDPGKDLETTYSIRGFSDLGQALAQRPDVAFICNPTSLHIPVALEAARAGCHLFLEKPLSHNLDGLDELIAAVEGKRLAAVVGYQLRFHPLLQRVHEVLTSGAIGQVLAVRMDVGERITKWHPYEDYRDMYASRRDLGGGVVLSQIHEMDYALWFFGYPEQVFAVGGKLSSLEVDVEDVASILMRCRVNGRVVPVHVHQDYVQDPPSRSCQVIGDAGKLVLDLRVPSLVVYGPDGAVTESRSIEQFARNKLFMDEIEHFLACARGEQKPVVSLRDGARSLRMALAARESLATGKVVELTSP